MKPEKILVVDDDEGGRALLSTVMSSNGYTVETAQSGAECLEKAVSFGPALILLDVFMPAMDGLEVTARLKADPVSRHIPIIILTAFGNEEGKLRCLNAGASDFLSKPVDQAELLVKVNNLLKLREFEEIRVRNELLEENKGSLEEKNRELEQAYSELKAAQARILQQEKMASIGQLAAGIAHEINNPVGFIMSNLGALNKFTGRLSEFMALQSKALETVSKGEGGSGPIMQEVADARRTLKIDFILKDMEDLVRESLDGAMRMKNIVQDLKSFSRVDEDEQKLSDLNKGLDSTINIVWNELKYKATLNKQYGNLPLVRCNQGQLNQVFMNLLVNAAQAIEKQGRIDVVTRHEEDRVYISISDTGSGISGDKLERIFEPFFTTKEVGKGTGLGLSIAYDIVKKHNGEITVQSAPGAGTVFTVMIPATEK